MIDCKNTSKEHLHNRTNELIIQGKIINKPKRNDDSYHVNESIVDLNIELLEYSNLLASDLSFAIPNAKQSSSTISWIHQAIRLIPSYQRLPIYLRIILLAMNMSEELLSQKH